MLLRRFSDKLYSPDDNSGSAAPPETIELLNEPDEPETLDLTPTIGKKTDEGTIEAGAEDEGEEEEIDEIKELEEELEPPSEEDLELMTPVRRKEILAKYPKLFKDFPYLEKAYYRDQQFTEILPTISDAKTAVEKAGILDRLDRDVMDGNITTVLQAAKTGDKEVFNKIADNYLPALRHVDEQAYYHVLGNVIKDTIITMVREGRALGEQGAPLQAAANVLNQFVFGSQNFQPPTTLSKQVKPEDNTRETEIKEREQRLVYSQFEGTKNDLQTRADNVLRATIDSHIDPKQSMTDYVKKNAAKDAFDSLETLLAKDTRFHTLLDKLWERAFQRQFDKESTDRIKSAYLSKAKTLLPSVIKKARNEALRGRARDDSDSEEPTTTRRSTANSGKSTAQTPSGKIKKASDIPKEMSTLDVLMQD